MWMACSVCLHRLQLVLQHIPKYHPQEQCPLWIHISLIWAISLYFLRKMKHFCVVYCFSFCSPCKALLLHKWLWFLFIFWAPSTLKGSQHTPACESSLKTTWKQSLPANALLAGKKKALITAYNKVRRIIIWGEIFGKRDENWTISFVLKVEA